MNLNPAESLNPIFNALDSLIENDGFYLYLGFVCLAGTAGHRLDIERRVAETDERKWCHGRSRHHLHDATAAAIPAANHRHRG
jgi:hypothetical protein